MYIFKKIDLLLTVLLPMLAGVLIYFSADHITLNAFIRNQLPDGLWAYSLVSCILIIWNRKINTVWLLATGVLFIVFELLQYLHIINGTGDLWDLLVYFIFSLIALITNTFIITTKQQPLS